MRSHGMKLSERWEAREVGVYVYCSNTSKYMRHARAVSGVRIGDEMLHVPGYM